VPVAPDSSASTARVTIVPGSVFFGVFWNHVRRKELAIPVFGQIAEDQHRRLFAEKGVSGVIARRPAPQARPLSRRFCEDELRDESQPATNMDTTPIISAPNYRGRASARPILPWVALICFEFGFLSLSEPRPVPPVNAWHSNSNGWPVSSC